MAFDNLKVDANLSDNFTLHLLLQNVSVLLLEKAVLIKGEPMMYSQLQCHIREVGQADEFIRVMHNARNSFASRPIPSSAFHPNMPRDPNVMDIDW